MRLLSVIPVRHTTPGVELVPPGVHDFVNGFTRIIMTHDDLVFYGFLLLRS